MTKTQLFGLAICAALILAILTITAWTGSVFGHHHDGPAGLQNFKHGLLFVILMVIALVFAAATRPMGSRS